MISVRVPPHVKDWLDARAQGNRRSLTGEVTTILEAAMLIEASDRGFAILAEAAKEAE